MLLLERGGWLPREPQNVSAEEVFVNGRYVSTDTWRYANGEVFQPEVHYFVGGATKMYGAALYRLRAEDFGELRHHDGISPAWPIGYDEMEPYYTLAERYYQVHGARGEDPTEPPASAPVSVPRGVSHEPRIQKLSDDLAAHGHHPFHAPCGVMLDEQNMPFSACMRCDNCDGFPCIVHAKSDAEVLGGAAGDRASQRRAVDRLRGGAAETNDAGTAVTGVIVNRDGATETVTGDIVVVSCGAANSARLLLMSATDKHPHGLANGSDQVGRNYMFHNSQAVLALSREENPTIFQKTLGINDFYFSGPDFDFPMGNIQMVGKSQAPMFRGEKPGETALAPSWTLRDVARHAVDFWLSTEDLPRPDNRVTRRRAGHDHDRLHSQQRGAQEAPLQPAQVDARETSTCTTTTCCPRRVPEERDPGRGLCPPGGHGQVRRRPGTSVLDANCKAHELDNLYVVDTSFFPSIGAVNPALTAMANAVRVGDHLLERMGAPVPSADATAVQLMSDDRKHVVIVGGGFAGLGCAERLAKHDEVDVTLIDRNNYHQFQPLLYQVATSQLAPSDIANSLRERVRRRGQRRRQAGRRSRRSTRRRRTVTSSDGGTWTGDALVVAAGSQPNFFGTAGAPENSFPLYSLDDATRLRSRILGLFEQVDRDVQLVDRGALNFVIVGGGPTGVEVAGAIADMISITVPAEYDSTRVRRWPHVHLIDHGDALLKPFSDSAHGYVSKVLGEKGVQIHLGTGVNEVGTGHARLSDGSVIPTRCVVWGGGIKAAAGRRRLRDAQGKGGRFDVDVDLTLAGRENVYVDR